MIEHEISYKNFDGNDVKTTFHFGLSKRELIELELDDGTNASMRDRLEKLTREKNNKEIFKSFQEIISMAVGRREGDRFKKHPEITADLVETNAFDEVVMDMMKNSGWAAKFITQMLPDDLAEEVAKMEEKNFSDEEILTMSDKRFFKTFGRDRTLWDKKTNELFHKKKQQKIAVVK